MWGAHTGTKSHMGKQNNSHVLASSHTHKLSIRASQRKGPSARRAAGGVSFPLSLADKSHQVFFLRNQLDIIGAVPWFGKVSPLPIYVVRASSSRVANSCPQNANAGGR